MKDILKNELKVKLPAVSENESVARAVVSAFSAVLNPTVEELADLRCAVSEAVTNGIVHAYPAKSDAFPGYLTLTVRLYASRTVTVEITDRGCGIADVEAARRPFYTTGRAGERSGMGFLVMESFTDEVKVKSAPGQGTTVLLRKRFRAY